MEELRCPKMGVHNLKFFERVPALFEVLHSVATQRDRAGNRHLYFDHYAALILLAFFDPIVKSLRGVQRASLYKTVQQKLGCSRTSIASLSEAARVFDAGLLQNIVRELAQEALPLSAGKDAQVLQGLTAIDGTLLPALPKMAWALWIDEEHRAAKLHLHFDVFKRVPMYATVTDGNGNEKKELHATLQSGRLYVLDCGYAEYRLFQDIVDAKSSFIGRIRDNAVYKVVKERPLSEEAREAGVVRDLVVWLGGDARSGVFKQKMRLVLVLNGKTDSKGRPEVMLLVSDRLDLDAAWISLGYKYRWTVELFFRWFKCILGCKHLLSTCQNGVTIQVYLALIASLLVALWSGHKPCRATFEILCHYYLGVADDDELQAYLRSLGEKKTNKA